VVDELELRLQRVIPAPPASVWAAFVEQLARWWGPEGFRVPGVDFEPRIGGRYRLDMQPPDGEPFHLSGEFREVDAPNRLAFTFAWDPPDEDDVETLAALSFHESGTSTEVTLTQGSFKTEARRELHRDGWSESFDRLERLL
jgi:uncharacterized protein YndB with AHSA1/START domain